MMFCHKEGVSRFQVWKREHLCEEARFRQISSSVDPLTVSGKRPEALRFKPKQLRAAFSPSCLGACFSFRDVAVPLPVVYVLPAGNVASSISSHTAKRPSRGSLVNGALRILAPFIVLRTRTQVSRSSFPTDPDMYRGFFCFTVLAEFVCLSETAVVISWQLLAKLQFSIS